MDSFALLTDRYELTMLRGALAAGTAERRCVFEVFARSLPRGRRYGVVAGTGRLVAAITQFRFDGPQLEYLLTSGVVDDATAEYLAGYRFSGDVWGYAEGECYFPGSPILVVEGTFAEAVLLETLALSILNSDCAVAAAASRMTSAAAGRPCADMGSRRTHEEAAVAAARAAYVAGFAATSNLEAGRRHGVPTMGTSAHAFTLLHDSEREAFTAQVAALGAGTTLLVDTYDVAEGVRTAVEVAGAALGAVRIDSGDLHDTAVAVRRQLDGFGAQATRIVASSDLDEHAIAALAGAPVDSYGVGTALVTGSGAPTAHLVYKLVARATGGSGSPLLPVSKRSIGKPTRGGGKLAFRRTDGDGVAVAEVLRPVAGNRYATEAASSPDERPLLVPLVRNGEVVAAEKPAIARDRHARSLAQLPAAARLLSPGEPAIPTLYEEVRP